MADPPRVVENAHVTLHYRLGSVGADHPPTDLISTFAHKPATLQLGAGVLSPGLEAKLVGLREGEHRVFDLAPGEAFGPRNADLVQRLARATYDFEIDPNGDHRPGDFVRIPGPDGGTFQGLLRELTPDYALLDFNHPLAGEPVTFEVKIIGVL